MDSIEIKGLIRNAICMNQESFNIKTMSQDDLDRYIAIAINAVLSSSSFKSYIKSVAE